MGSSELGTIVFIGFIRLELTKNNGVYEDISQLCIKTMPKGGVCMAQAKADLPTLEIDRDIWVDLEIPFGKFKEKWDREYRAELKRYVGSGIIDLRVIEIYLRLLDLTDVPNREVALDNILSHDEDWGVNLLCLKHFSDYKNVQYFKHFRPFLYRSVEGTELHDLYNRNYQTDNKLGLAALLQLYDPDGTRLKTIRGLDYCHNKKPQIITAASGTQDVELTENTDEIIQRMEEDETRKFSKWHTFDYNGEVHVLIKRELGDSVERQATGNIEEEPAEFVVLRLIDNHLEVISSTKEIANIARNAVNETLEDVEFSEIETGDEHEQLENTVQGFFGSGDVEPIEDDGVYELEQGRLTVTGIKISNSPLPGHPKLQMKSDLGIMRAVRALRGNQYDLTENIDDVEVIHTKFREREYTIRPKERQISDNEIYWVFQYDVKGATRDERNAFEAAMEDLFDITLVYERS